MKSERDVWLFLNQIPDLGPLRLHRLLDVVPSVEAILELSVADLQAAEVSESVARRWHESFRDPKRWEIVEKELGQIDRGDFQVVTERDADYPASLRELLDRPPVLYYKGQWPVPQGGAVGLVGTRRSSPYGCAVAERLAADLAAREIVTVSGLARGIDACIHRATLKSHGFTVAVLGNGLAHRYPKENAQLHDDIAAHGVLVSEFPYDSPPEAWHFPCRNRIIAGLSQGVVVIEAGEHSGALITARCAAEQGRDVFAVPGSIFQSTSVGCHRLLKQGAKLVENVSDILEELEIPVRAQSPSPLMGEGRDGGDTRGKLPPTLTLPHKGGGNFLGRALTPLEEEIYVMLSDDPVSIETIAQSLQNPVDQLANALLSLELKGMIQSLPGQRYVAAYPS